MKIGIESNILKHYLRNVYFITGTAYAGKSTMVRMLADRCGMIFCGENYHHYILPEGLLDSQIQPNLCYFETMESWQAFVNRTPEEYDAWISGSSREAADIEIAELLRLSADGRKIIVDTNIPLPILHAISDYSRVAVMLSPCSMSVERFFDGRMKKSSSCCARFRRPTIRMQPWRTSVPASRASTARSTTRNMQTVGFSPLCARIRRRIPERKLLQRSCAISG